MLAGHRLADFRKPRVRLAPEQMPQRSMLMCTRWLQGPSCQDCLHQCPALRNCRIKFSRKTVAVFVNAVLYLPPFSPVPSNTLIAGKRDRLERKNGVISLSYFLLFRIIRFLGANPVFHSQEISNFSKFNNSNQEQKRGAAATAAFFRALTLHTQVPSWPLAFLPSQEFPKLNSTTVKIMPPLDNHS